jgi:RHS repeat-associated protein
MGSGADLEPEGAVDGQGMGDGGAGLEPGSLPAEQGVGSGAGPGVSASPETQDKRQGAIQTTLGYAGMFYHARSGLYLTHYRAYDPRLGRWLSRDPIWESGGINLYGYVGGDPVGWVDPSGLLLGGLVDAGESYGEEAAQYWADLAVQTGNPIYDVPGALAALWTSDTSDATASTLLLGIGIGRYLDRPYWQYYPAENPDYSSGWLTRGQDWEPPYTPGPEAARNLSLPPYNPGTAVRPIRPPWYKPIRGPKPVEPEYCQLGGGTQYYRGWRWPHD